MTLAQVQPLNTPTASELTKAQDFLREAYMLVTDVRSLFLNSDNFATAARLKDIQGRLADEDGHGVPPNGHGTAVLSLLAGNPLGGTPGLIPTQNSSPQTFSFLMTGARWLLTRSAC